MGPDKPTFITKEVYKRFHLPLSLVKSSVGCCPTADCCSSLRSISIASVLAACRALSALHILPLHRKFGSSVFAEEEDMPLKLNIDMQPPHFDTENSPVDTD